LLTDAQQDTLNQIGINVLRVFSGNVVVWGARTLSTDTLWRYINVRRLVNYVEESIQVGLRWAVFEPNTLTLRKQITRAVRDFLDGVWRDGGLFGATAEEAYYVRFPELYNTDAERALGRLTVEIGLRVSFPAEFIIVRIGLILQSPTAP
jgi:phage tail sheath protein FI